MLSGGAGLASGLSGWLSTGAARVAVSILTLTPGLAHAACTGGGGDTNLSPPPLVEFSAKDVAVNAPLTPWLPLSGGAPTTEFRCDSSANISYRVESHGGYVDPRYHESGQEFMVYRTGVEGVGMAFLVESWRGGARPSGLGYNEVELYAGDSGVGPVGARVMIKYIRIGPISHGSTSTSREMVIQSRLYEGGSGSPRREDLWVSSTTLKVQDKPSCRMRAQEVNMGSIPVSAFKGVGTTAGQRTYELALDCEAGVGQVDYQVVPTTAVIDAGLGLAEATGGVKGVAYQFLESGDVPMRFYSTGLFGYGSASAQVLRKTFGVRYRQTESTITPGPANAGLTFSLTFP